MGLLDILNGGQSFQFYGGGGPNTVSSGVSFGQKTIGYPGGAFLKKEDKPIIRIPLPDSGVTFKQLNPGLIAQLIGLGKLDPEEVEKKKKDLGLDFLSDFKEKIRYESKFWGPDVLNRGNLYGLVRASDDLTRLTRFFTSKNVIEGLLFLTKQNLLSRVGTGFGSETPKTVSNALGVVKEGLYLPTSTIIQAAANGIGGHFLKQGIDPTGKIPLLKLPTYEKINREGSRGNKPNKNRLVKKLKRLSKESPTRGNVIEAYGGGPGSRLGIGRTRIKYATDSSGKEKINSLITIKDLNRKFTNFLTWDNSGFLNYVKSNDDSSIREDFRKQIFSALRNKSPKLEVANKQKRNLPKVKFLSASPNYKAHNIENRLNYRGGGRPGDISNYELGKRALGAKILAPNEDKINMSSIYQSEKVNDTKKDQLKDIIDFRIGIFANDTIKDNSNTIEKNWLHFRVLLDKFGENYKAGWKAQEYMGRAEKFYRYGSFDRSVSLSFQVVAFSKQELMPIYRKLNYFVSHLAPYYSKEGYMSGNLCQMTLGNWLVEQPGFIDSISLDIDKDSPWEVNLGLDGEEENQGGPVVKQVPHMVKVNIKFTPIHKYRPQIQSLEFEDDQKKKIPNFKGEDVVSFGDEKYISLKSETGDGYNQISPQLQQNVSQLTNATSTTTQTSHFYHSAVNPLESIDQQIMKDIESDMLSNYRYSANSTQGSVDFTMGMNNSGIDPETISNSEFDFRNGFY